MSKPEPDLDRLLRAAAQGSEPVPEMPFGFETRVVARARAEGPSRAPEAWELARLLRRVAVFSLIVIAFASSASYWQLLENENAAEPYTNDYAIADTAMAEEFSE